MYYLVGITGMVTLPVQPLAKYSSPDMDPERTGCWDRIIARHIQKNLLNQEYFLLIELYSSQLPVIEMFWNNLQEKR